MNIQETREIIIHYFEAIMNFNLHKKGCMLRFGNNTYRIMPDDAFYYDDKVLLFEYENNLRPVESISKYFWLLENKALLNEKVKIKLLLTINNVAINEIRTQSIQILGNILNQNYPKVFEFHYLTYNELSEENLKNKLDVMTSIK